MSEPPVTDRRSAADVLGELIADVPGYLRYLRPQPGQSGFALLQVLSRYCSLVIHARNDAVAKGQLAFLDALGIDLLPPQAASAEVVFELTPSSPVDSALPQNSQVAAPPNPTLPSSITAAPSPSPALPADPVVFGTDEAVAVARASLITLYSTYADVDESADHTAAIQTGFWLYKDQQPVEHDLYLGHDSLFALAGDVDVSLTFGLAGAPAPAGTTNSGRPKLPKGLALAWEYSTSGGWIGFDLVDDHTFGLSLEGEVKLHKRSGPPAASTTIDGIQSYWIRARLQTPLPGTGRAEGPALPVVETIRAELSLEHGQLPCDTAFADGFQIDTSKDFLPFGSQPGVSSSFVFACDQAFQQTGALIGISLAPSTGPTPTPSDDLALAWEYSVGPGLWQALGAGGTQFVDHTANFTTATLFDPAITFFRPPDWAEVDYNGSRHYWLRVRVAAGSYGGPPTYSVDSSGGNWTVVASNVPQPPSLASFTLSYTYQVGPFIQDHCLALNGFAYLDFSDAARWGQPPFLPFSPLPDQYAAVYFGFDEPLPVGLVSLYVSVPGRVATAPQPSPYAWEYLAPGGWTELAVRDQTAGFATSGSIQLIGPPDAQPAPGPGGPTYWVRARLRQPGDPAPLPVGAVYLNAVAATQRQSVQGEVLGRSDGTPRLAMQTQKSPVLGEQLLEVQEWQGTGSDWESLFSDLPPSRLRYDRDARSTVNAVWVTWEERPYLYLSQATDRHYEIERSTGLVGFGDGTAGMVPPPGCPVMLSYNYGGGVAGNVAAGSISQVYSAVPYLQRAFNPLPASDGAAGETLAEVARRGPQRIRNAGRSVAAADYEWLAREASPEVAIARCLSTSGPAGYAQPGWVTMVIVPQGSMAEPQPTQELLGKVEAALAAEAPAAIADQIRVTGPRYREISVVAELVPADPGQAAALQDAVTSSLNAFLHPVTGGPGGVGWEFGATVHLSQVAQVVLEVPGVVSAPQVSLVSGTDVYGDSVPVPADSLPSAGKHDIKLSLGGTA
jgi:Baseplate J-like protein